VNRKKQQNVFLIYSLQNLTNCDKIWYILSWVILPYRNVNVFCLTWIVPLPYPRGVGRSQKLRMHGGYKPRTDAGHSKKGAAPSTAEGHAGGRSERVTPPATAVRGCHCDCKCEILHCDAFSALSPGDLHPRMKAMRSLKVRRDRENYL